MKTLATFVKAKRKRFGLTQEELTFTAANFTLTIANNMIGAAMNTLCAAGTGMFISSLAKRLNVNMFE